MHRALTLPCLSAVALVLGAEARAETTISSSTSNNEQTSTVAGGAADDIAISSGVTLTSTAGTAVLIDSNNSVSNAGAISSTDVDGAVGIGAAGGLTSTITNSGSITVTETYAAADANDDDIVDGAFAEGANRYGIRVGGDGAFTGTITNSGTISVKGNTSSGIAVDVPLAGDLIHSGTITVTGDNGYGVRLDDVTGKVTIAGSVTATGENTVGVGLLGTVTGQVVVHGSVVTTGYSSTTLPDDTSTLGADNLLQGGAALQIGSSVTGGVLIAVAPTDTTDTEIDSDADGIADASESTGIVLSYGAAPGLLVGSATAPVTLGAFGDTGYGLVINGLAEGFGTYAGVNATAVQIGGLGGAVTIAGGINNAGTISARANGGVATGLLIGAGATVPTLVNSGAISGYTLTTAAGAARGLVIDAAASLPTIVNSGTLAATMAVSGGAATAVLDQSGTLTSLTSSGWISAADLDGTARAIDVSANTSGFSYTQAQIDSALSAPSLVGQIVTGSGNDRLAISAGTVTGGATLGAGDDVVALSGSAAYAGTIDFGAGDDRLSLADTAGYSGTVDFGTGADSLTVGSGATFAGTIANTTPNVALAVDGGTVNFTGTGTVTLGSLALNGGRIGVVIDPTTATHGMIAVAGATTVAAGSTLGITLTALPATDLRYTVLTSGTLSGVDNLGLSIDTLPYLLTGALDADVSAGTVSVSVLRKSATALGLRTAEASAYDAVYAAIAGDSAIADLFLGLTGRDDTLLRYRQMLPDYAGGVFDLVSRGTRILARGEAATPWASLGGLDLWVQQSFFGTHRKSGAVDGYDGSGWGLSGGGDVALGGFGRVGLSLGYIYGSLNEIGANTVSTSQFQGGAYWRAESGGLKLSATASGGYVALDSERALSGTSSTLVSSTDRWSGLMVDASLAASYEARFGRFYLRPDALLAYDRLHEGGHQESGGGTGFDLDVASRTSDELAATAMLAVGVHFGKQDDPDLSSVRFELKGGRREILAGSVGATTASFAGGTSFTLQPGTRSSGYVGEASGSFGAGGVRVTGSAIAETRDGYRSIAGKIALTSSF
jgi:hypothetical protein